MVESATGAVVASKFPVWLLTSTPAHWRHSGDLRKRNWQSDQCPNAPANEPALMSYPYGQDGCLLFFPSFGAIREAEVCQSEVRKICQARRACPPPWRPLSAGLTSRSVARAMIEQLISGSSVPVAILLHACCFRVGRMGLIARTAEWLDHCALRGERSHAVARKGCLSGRTHEHVRGHRRYDFCANISIR
jgi:hypothetical protein